MMQFVLRCAAWGLVSAGVFACSGSIDPALQAKGDGDELTLGAIGDRSDEWTKIQACESNAPEDPIHVESVNIEGSTLTVAYGHGGGCETHLYALCYEQWEESDPIGVGVRLLHDARGDGCEAYLTGELEFDLSPLEEAYESAYGTSSGQIALSIQQESIVHSFGETAPSWDEIEAAIDELNSCAVVDDCVAVPTTPCAQAYVNAEADISELSEMLRAYNDASHSGGDWACTDDCQCGLLTCDAGKCVTTQHDCVSEPEAGRPICL